MKKLMLTIAFFATVGFTSLAIAQTSSVNPTHQTQTEDKFVKIEVSALPEAVTAAIAKEYEGATVKEAFQDKEAGLYKVVITVSEKEEKTVVYNEKGEVQEAPKA